MVNELDSAVVDKKAMEVCPNLTLKLPDLVQLLGCVPCTLNVFFAQRPCYVTQMLL